MGIAPLIDLSLQWLGIVRAATAVERFSLLIVIRRHATRERILASVKIVKTVVTLLVKGRISCGVVVFLVPD